MKKTVHKRIKGGSVDEILDQLENLKIPQRPDGGASVVLEIEQTKSAVEDFEAFKQGADSEYVERANERLAEVNAMIESNIDVLGYDPTEEAEEELPIN